MTYQQTLNYLYGQLPMFTRDGASAFKKDLTNTIELCKRLDDPHRKFKTIHVGGTNGKGSTSHMLAAVLQVAGYKTGLYTSPHLRDFRERIRVNGEMISEETVVNFVAENQKNLEEIQPSFFEMTVALAFDVFAKEQVDIAVIEVGLGGRLDSTNIITPLLSVITNIGWDHMNMLGNTLQLIAGEKAGIIKQGIPVVIGEYQPEVAEVFEQKAAQENAPLTFASQQWDVKPKQMNDGLLTIQVSNSLPPDLPTSGLSYFPTSRLTNFLSSGLPDFRTYQLDLTGTYQQKNVKTVLSAVEELQKQGFNISDEHITTALRQVKTLTGLHGRWETLGHSPLIICDTGHNPDGIAEVLKNIEATPYRRLHFVLGMVNDKDSSKVLSMLPANATYYFCRPAIPRGLDARQLQQEAAAFHLRGNVFTTVNEAYQAAKQQANADDLIFIGGSTFVVAEVV